MKEKKQKNTDREFPNFTVGRKGQVNIFFFLALVIQTYGHAYIL